MAISCKLETVFGPSSVNNTEKIEIPWAHFKERIGGYYQPFLEVGSTRHLPFQEKEIKTSYTKNNPKKGTPKWT